MDGFTIEYKENNNKYYLFKTSFTLRLRNWKDKDLGYKYRNDFYNKKIKDYLINYIEKLLLKERLSDSLSEKIITKKGVKI